jgi:hypothetical protein
MEYPLKSKGRFCHIYEREDSIIKIQVRSEKNTIEKQIQIQNQAHEKGVSIQCALWSSHSYQGIQMECLEKTLQQDLLELNPEQLSFVKSKFPVAFITSVLDYEVRMELITLFEEATRLDSIQSVYSRMENLFIETCGTKPPLIETCVIPDDVVSDTKRVSLQSAFTKLQELHQIGIIHGDPHVDNFMTKKGTYYLIDFGKSKQIEHSVEDEEDDVNLFRCSLYSFFCNCKNPRKETLLPYIGMDLYHLKKNIVK